MPPKKQLFKKIFSKPAESQNNGKQGDCFGGLEKKLSDKKDQSTPIDLSLKRKIPYPVSSRPNDFNLGMCFSRPDGPQKDAANINVFQNQKLALKKETSQNFNLKSSAKIMITDVEKRNIIEKIKSESRGKDLENLYSECPVCNKVIKRLEKRNI